MANWRSIWPRQGVWRRSHRPTDQGNGIALPAGSDSGLWVLRNTSFALGVYRALLDTGALGPIKATKAPSPHAKSCDGASNANTADFRALASGLLGASSRMWIRVALGRPIAGLRTVRVGDMAWRYISAIAAGLAPGRMPS